MECHSASNFSFHFNCNEFNFRFDFETNRWTDMARMIVSRNSPAHAVVLDRIYVFGGYGGGRRTLNSVECYDSSTNESHMVAPMHRGRSQATACALHGFIYVFGGLSDGIYISSIERYDTRVNSWIEVIILPFSHLRTEQNGSCEPSFHIFRWNSLFIRDLIIMLVCSVTMSGSILEDYAVFKKSILLPAR